MNGYCKTMVAAVIAATSALSQPSFAQTADSPSGDVPPEAPADAPLHAPTPVTPLDDAGFDARTIGRTIHYNSFGAPYGVEEYLPDHKVKWIFAEGQCKMGEWFQSGNQICFTYQDEPDLQCWIFADQPKGLMAWFNGELGNEPLVSTSETNVPLDCEMMDVGV
jgi:hypothetical protein